MLKVVRVLKPVFRDGREDLYSYCIYFDGPEGPQYMYRMTLDAWHALGAHLGGIDYSEVWTDGNANQITVQQ